MSILGELPLDATRFVRLTSEGRGLRVAIIDAQTGVETGSMSMADRSRESIERVAAAVRSLRAPIVRQRWAEGRWDDPKGVLGSWLVTVDDERRDGSSPAPLDGSVVLPATLWWWSGAEWMHGASGRYLVGRAWLEADADIAVVRGLNVALLAASPVAVESRDAAVFAATFGGIDDVAPLPRDPFAAAAFDATARAGCAKGTRRSAEAEAIMRALRSDTCGEGPIAPSGACGALLDALKSSGTPPCNAKRSDVPCPRRLSAEDVEQRLLAGTYEAIPGPFETTRPHVAGSDLCCWFHPITQDRLALQAKVRRQLFARDPDASDATLYSAIRTAEKKHAWEAVWAACDARARKEAEAFSGRIRSKKNVSEFQLWVSFVNALLDHDERLYSFWHELKRENPHLRDEEVFLDPTMRHLWDWVHQAAHESGLNANVAWAHRMMRRFNVPVMHPKAARRFVSG